MRSKLSLLVKDGLNKKINTKWFKVVNIILLLLIVALLNIDGIIKLFGGDFNEKTTIYVYDKTEKYYDALKTVYNTAKVNLTGTNAEIAKGEGNYKDEVDKIKENKGSNIVVLINDLHNVEIISFDYIDALTIQVLNASLEQVKTNIVLNESSISPEELAKIYEPVNIERTYLNEDLDENYELINTIGNLAIPVFIMPFFFLIIMVTQMIGAEINEEKTSKSMEIIVTSVSPKIHFLSKMITSNLYAIIQALLFIVYFGIGALVRTLVTGTSFTGSLGESTTKLLNTFVESGMLNNILKCLPFIIIMILLSFFAYSLLAGILASMTTSQEDFQQLQTPMMMLIMAGYFLAIMASTYEKSTFIMVVSMIPFISCILSPVLLFLGQIGIMHVIISLALLLLVIYLLLKYGLRIYKAGILNYSSSNLWKKMLESIKVKD